jgi:hypothetical protein
MIKTNEDANVSTLAFFFVMISCVINRVSNKCSSHAPKTKLKVKRQKAWKGVKTQNTQNTQNARTREEREKERNAVSTTLVRQGAQSTLPNINRVSHDRWLCVRNVSYTSLMCHMLIRRIK